MWGSDGTTLDTEADTFSYTAPRSTASTVASYSGNNTTFSLPISDMDVIHGDNSDTIDLIGTGWKAITEAAVQTNGSIDKRVFATTSKDVVVFKDGTDFYVAFETTNNGSAGVFGPMEISKLVGLVDESSRFSMTASSNLTFIIA